SRRTRSSEARGDNPTVCASFWMVERPSRCSAARIFTSMRSRAGGRLAGIDVYVPRCAVWSINRFFSGAYCVSSGGRRVTGEDEVAIFGRLMAGKASFVQRLVARSAILEVGKSPAGSRGVHL